MSEEYGSSQDPTRLCPTCRMPISVLATRCRHCGETVARPRKEEAKLTIHDLGGETRTNYVISGNVMDALEAFRADEQSAQETARQEKVRPATWFGKRPTPPPGHRQESELPHLDEKHQELSDLVAPKSQTTSRTLPRSTPAFPQITRTVFLIAGIVAGLVILWFGTDFTWAKINEILERRRQLEQPNYTSKAHNMLLAGEPIDRVYKEAAGAVKTTDKEENRQMLEEVRLELIDKVEKILNSPTLDRRGMDSASQWVTLAAELDSDPRVQALAQRVQRDVFAYSMVLVKVDATAGEATFRLNNPQFGVDTQTVKLGELVQDRFLVRAITERSVQLVDSKVETPVGGNRKLIAMPMSVINSM